MGMSRTMKSITWVICLVVLAGVAVGGYFAYKATEKPRDPAPQTGALVVSHGELRDNAGKVIDLSQPLVVGDIYQVVNENEEGFSFKVNPENEGHETSITGVVGEAETLTIPGSMEINKDIYEVVSIEENAFTEATSLKNLYVADSIDTTSSNLSASFELQSASDVEGYDLYIKSVVVSFNANGGICETTSNELISGEVYGELPVATRTGYTFDGWYTALENGTRVETTTTVPQGADHTLYAHWTINTYNVVLNEIGGNDVDDLTYTVETTTLTLPTLTRDGYTFNGWFTAEVGGTKVEATDILSKLENQKYYAHWTANQFTVIFDSNKPADATAEVVGTMESQTFTYDALQNLTANTYSLECYNFAGWSKTANGSVEFTDGQSVKNLATEGSITLYAVWLADNERVITFEGNGVVVNPSTIIVTVGDTYGALPTLTRAGYTFDGWFTALENGTRVETTTTVPEGANHTLYAHWTINTYNVVLNEIGGNNVDDLTYTVETTTLTLPTLTKANYVFDGWFTAEVGGTKVESTDILSKLENQTYYAQWTPEEYDVILEENGGDLINDITYTIESEDITLPTPTRDGYTFIGWFGVKVVSGTTYYVGMDFLTTNNNALAYTSLDNTNLNDANKVVAIDCDVFAVNIGSGTLIAKWEEIVVSPIMVGVTFNANGGSVNPETATLTVGETYGTLPTPTRDGYTFDGWYTALKNGTKVESSTLVTATEDHTLYAQWVANTYTVTLDNQSATTAGTTSVTATYGSAMPTITVPTRTGYTFGGYFSETEGNGTQYYNADGTSARTWNIANDATLYAKWTELPPVYFNSNWKNLLATDVNGTATGITKKTIKTIEFTTVMPTDESYNANNYILVGATARDSTTVDSSVIAYYYKDSDNLYHLAIVSPTGAEIYAPTDCSSLFSDCSAITTIEFNSFITTGVTDMSAMFSDCNALTSIGNLSGWNVSSVTFMNAMFSDCDVLTSVGDLSGWNVSSVTTMAGMFYSCDALTSIGDLSGWDVSSVTNMVIMFNSCKALTSLDLSGWDVSSVTNIATMFKDCNALTSLDLSGWNLTSVTNTTSWLYHCTNLVEIKAPKSIAAGIALGLPRISDKSWYVTTDTSAAVTYIGNDTTPATLGKTIKVGVAVTFTINSSTNYSNVSIAINGVTTSLTEGQNYTFTLYVGDEITVSATCKAAQSSTSIDGTTTTTRYGFKIAGKTTLNFSTKAATESITWTYDGTSTSYTMAAHTTSSGGLTPILPDLPK